MIIEHALLPVRPGQEDAYEAAFAAAKHVIARAPGFAGLTLSRCLDRPGTYRLTVHWQRLEDHTEGFRRSAGYEEWRRLLHPFYETVPAVEYSVLVHEQASSVPEPTALPGAPGPGDTGPHRGNEHVEEREWS